MEKIVTDKVIRRTETKLSVEDRKFLKRKRDSTISIMTVYYLLVVICSIFFLARDNSSLNLDNKSFRVHFASSETENLGKIVPYIFIALLILSSLYYVVVYIRKINPIIKDLANGTKTIIYFIAKKEVMSRSKSSLLLPLQKNRSVEIEKKLFRSLDDKDELCLELSSSGIIIRITKKDVEIKTL